MSSPTGGRYTVESAEERRRRRLAEAERRCGLLEQQLRDILPRAVAFARTYLNHDLGLRVPDRPASDREPALLDRHSETLERLLETARATLAEAQQARARKLVTTVSEGGQGGRARSAGAARNHGVAPAVPPESGLSGSGREPGAKRVATAARLMSRLPIEAREDERERVEALAAELAEGRDPDRVEVALRQAVEQSHRRVQRRQAELARAAALRQQLAPYLDQQRATDPDEQLASVVEDGRSLSFELERDAVAAVDACARETDRRLAASAAADAFRELGYDVEEGFESLAVDHGAAHVTRPGWEGYAIRWRLQDRRMRFQVVGAADRGWTTGGNEVRDREVQAAFCDELLRVQEQFGAHGIGFTVDEAVEPGQRPVEQVEQLPFRQYRRRASEAPRAKRRQR